MNKRQSGYYWVIQGHTSGQTAQLIALWYDDHECFYMHDDTEQYFDEDFIEINEERIKPPHSTPKEHPAEGNKNKYIITFTRYSRDAKREQVLIDAENGLEAMFKFDRENPEHHSVSYSNEPATEEELKAIPMYNKEDLK